MTSSSFRLLPLSEETIEDNIQERLDKLRAERREALEVGDTKAVKRIGERFEREEASLRELQDRIGGDVGPLDFETAGFDYIVVDTSPSFDDATLTALDETDECVIVATLDVPTLKNVKVALETMDMLSIARGHRHLLLNRADDAVGISVEKVESILGMPVSAQVGSAIDIAAATNSGTPIVSHKPHHPASQAYFHLASSVTGEPVSAPTPTTAEPAVDTGRSRGLFRRGRNS